MKRSDRVAAGVLFLFACLTIQQALALPYWHEFAPGPGFLPFWLGVLLASTSAALFVRRARVRPWRPERASLRRLVAMVAFSVLAAAASPWVGMVVASGAFLCAALFYLNPHRRLTNVAVAVGGPLVVWLIFVRWLTVPLPRGPWGF